MRVEPPILVVVGAFLVPPLVLSCLVLLERRAALAPQRGPQGRNPYLHEEAAGGYGNASTIQNKAPNTGSTIRPSAPRGRAEACGVVVRGRDDVTHYA